MPRRWKRSVDEVEVPQTAPAAITLRGSNLGFVCFLGVSFWIDISRVFYGMSRIFYGFELFWGVVV